MDTEPFDYTGLPDLPAMATDVQKNNRAFEIAKYDNSNAARVKYRAARIVEVKSELGDDIALALEARAQLLLKKLKRECVVGTGADSYVCGVKMFDKIGLPVTYSRVEGRSEYAYSRAYSAPKYIR